MLLLPVLLSISSAAQEVAVRGGFVTDSLMVGEETAFYLAGEYPESTVALFPDSTFGFAPFEFLRKKYFPTTTRDGISHDSAVFYLTTYEINELQTLQLPVYILSAGDCTAFQSNTDSIRLILTMHENVDSIAVEKLPLRMNTAYHPVSLAWNTTIMKIAAAGLVVLAFFLWLIFGRRISRHMAARRLEKKHSQFIRSFDASLESLRSSFSPVLTESTLASWKTYMEQLDRKPYTKLTSRELWMLSQDDRLGATLRSIDRVIYGADRAPVEPLTQLKTVATQHFQEKLKQIRHGK